MAISPLVPGAFRAAETVRSLRGTRAAMDDLQRQVVTGKRSETYGGLGAGRITSLAMRAKAAEVSSYRETIIHLQVRAKQLDLGLTQLGKIGGDLKSSTFLPQFDPDATGKTTMQKYARGRLDEAIDILNTSMNGQYLYAGRNADQRPVLDVDTILNGDAAGRAGVRQLIAERKAADLGGGTGRLNLGGAGTVATIVEDGVHPFGFKLTAASSTTPSITAALAAGPPASIAYNVAALPADGDEVRFELTLPDGGVQPITLTARSAPISPTASASAFEIGVTPAATAANLRNAIAAAIANQTGTTLSAASANVGADAFFAGSPASPPLRVVGPPATATALAPGTAANTVIWYRGDDTSPDPRATAGAKIDTGIAVKVGVQANEQGFQRLLSSLSVFVTETFASTPAEQGRYQAMSDRIRADLGQTAGVQRIESIQLEIGLAASTMQTADDRHRTRAGFVQDVIAGVEDVTQEEAAAKLLTLQTKLQASYQTTSILSRLTLTEYLR
ncbi:MAG: flagellin [Beijerinckiaceae bacterium]